MTHYFNNEPEGQTDRGRDRAESWDPSDLKIVMNDPKI